MKTVEEFVEFQARKLRSALGIKFEDHRLSDFITDVEYEKLPVKLLSPIQAPIQIRNYEEFVKHFGNRRSSKKAT